MALIDYKKDQFYCNRCSNCKFIPSYRIKAGDPDHINICPAITKYGFHAYSGSGKLEIGYSINDGHTDVCETTKEVAYRCTMCGACDYHCKLFRKDIDVLENIEELRKACADAGFTYPEHQAIINTIISDNNQLGRTSADRIDYAADLDVKRIDRKETGKIYFHAGDLAGYTPKLADRAKRILSLLLEKGLDVVVSGGMEPTAADKAFELGFTEIGIKAAKKLADEVVRSGAEMVVTLDAHAYQAFRYHYPRHGVTMDANVVHITQLTADLIRDGLLKPVKTADMKVTYHDPCNLGRKSEPFRSDYRGQNKRRRPMELVRTGDFGEYAAPREILEAIPGVELIEMNRKKGWAYCCGNGAGVAEVNPDLLMSTSKERAEEAKKTGADVVVTACPMCEYALAKAGDIPVADIMDLVLGYYER